MVESTYSGLRSLETVVGLASKAHWIVANYEFRGFHENWKFDEAQPVIIPVERVEHGIPRRSPVVLSKGRYY